MIGIAAGLALEGMDHCYTIAHFQFIDHLK